MTFTFTVGYTPNRKADTEEWNVEIEANSEEEAHQEMDSRYPSDAGYDYRIAE